MLSQMVNEPDKTEWAAAIYFASEMDKSLQFCVDYRKLIAVTNRDSYPIPWMNKSLDFLGGGATVLHFGCKPCPLASRSLQTESDETIFKSDHGQYRFERMHFGLKNAPKIFQCTKDFILLQVKGLFALVYLDDIGVSSWSSRKHIKHVRRVLSLLRDTGVTTNLKKCILLTSRIKYPSHAIGYRRLE